MTGAVAAAAGGGCHIFSGCGFPAPGLQDFIWTPIFTIGSFSFTKLSKLLRKFINREITTASLL